MKEKRISKVRKRASKRVIMNSARKGIYDGNPLLATPHQVTCKDCGSAQKVTYLDHLKKGRFELGKTEAVEVSYAAPTITGLGHASERITPVIVRVRCQKCGAETSCSPISLEYLFFTAEKQREMEHMYV